MATERKWFIRNIAEVPWRQFPDHFGGALSKPLVMPETAGSQHIDYRISMYQPMAYVKVHQHKVQEQVYHVLEGEGLMHIDGKDHVVRKHDFIFLPPGVDHVDLTTPAWSISCSSSSPSPVTRRREVTIGPRRAPHCVRRAGRRRRPSRDGGRGP